MYTRIIFAVVLTVLLVTCKKDINDRSQNFPALDPKNLDENAGTWKPILITSPSEFSVANPILQGTPDYTIQINEVKSFQKNLSSEDKKNIAFWSAGAVLRWNEIMRSLVAKYNLPPYQNEDRTYPAPNANNPLAYPFFPFANPPYASRAYAYLSGAQYDALVTAMHFKTLNSRKAPYAVESTIEAFIPRSTLNSYPSEDAVVAGASLEILKLMFPGEQSYLDEMYAQHMKARIASGANLRSDLDAGFKLGKEVATLFIQRARRDRAGAAIGNKEGWDKLKTDTEARHEKPWKSLEFPERPPMLPLFGNVWAFLFDSATLVTQIRPGPPPSTSSDKFKEEVEEVYQYAKNATKEQIGYVHFWADGVGTSTPSGHWNAIAADDWVKENFSEVRWARNYALLNLTMMDCAIACWDAKYAYFNPRPSDVNPNIKTSTGVPNFPSYISGHSTFSSGAATILSHILPQHADKYGALASQASMSRVYAGIHFMADVVEGQKVGDKVGQLAVERAKTDGAE